jgi:hypothetical protein
LLTVYTQRKIKANRDGGETHEKDALRKQYELTASLLRLIKYEAVEPMDR